MINRNALRTALTAGLGNAFASLSGVEFSQYVALAVLAVSSGTYGGALALGRQRLLGTALGSVLLLIGYEGLRGLPMPLALALTLGALRLLGGLLKLQVGYKVGGIVIVMGWLVHEGGLAAWIPLRFFWTCFGVLITLLGLRLFWPARGLDTNMTQVAGLLGQLQRCFCDLAARVDPAAAGQGEGADPIGIGRYRALRNQLVAIRRQRPALLQELGSLPERHPAMLLMANFEATISRLITLVGGLCASHPPYKIPSWWCSCTGPKRSCCRPWPANWANGKGRSVGAVGCQSRPRAGCSCRAAGRSWARSSTTPPPTWPPWSGWSGSPAG